MGQIVKVYKDGVGYQVLNTNNIGDALEAGDNISINGNEISAVDTKYSAGTGLRLSGTTFSLNVNYGADLSLSIDPSTFVLTAQLKDQNGSNIGSAQTIDLPLESVVVSGTYNAQTKEVELTLKSGDVISFSVADLVSGLQEELVVGNGININANNEISVDTSVVATQTDLDTKQDTLTAGTNISIDANNEISAVDTKYSAGTGINIDANNVISSTVTPGQTYTAGNGIDINQNNEISVDTSVVATQTDIANFFDKTSDDADDIDDTNSTNKFVTATDKNTWNGKQDELIAGTNIQIAADGKTISATDTKYSAGTGINIDANNVISSTVTPGQTYTAGNGINIDSNNEISNTLPGPTISATAPTGTEGALWYDTTNDVLKTYNGTNWIAVGEDSNMKMFIISGYGDNTTGQAIYDYYKSGKTPFARWGNIVYAVKKYSTSGTSFQLELSAGFHGADVVSNTYSASYEDELIISGDNDVVNATMPQGGEIIKYLATDKNYSTPYTPQYNGSPATKKYVDDNIVTYTAGTNISIDANNEISAVDTKYSAGTGINIDSNNVISATATPGQTYTAGNGINIDANNEISNTLPGPTIATTAPTGTEGALWYDTTNDVLKVYNGTNWDEVGSDASNINTKTFYLSSTSDLTNAQAAWDWYKSGKNPIIIYDNKAYTVFAYQGTGQTALTFASNGIGNKDGNSNSNRMFALIRIIASSDVVNYVSYTTNDTPGKYLRTDYNYSTPYTPTYDGSPATKKYVDDNIVTYTAGTNISIDANNEISAVDTKYSAGTGINIDSNNVISATATPGQTYTAGNGINIDANNEISNTLPGPTIAATAPTGTEGALWYDTTNDVLMAHDGTAWKEAGTQMKVLSYGHSTRQDFLNAYNENAIVYCRASSNSNPGSGVQGRMAFMAFVSLNSSTGVPQNVEFQYYRSRSDHNTQANQLDEVYVYKLESNGTWSVTQRNTASKAVAGTGINLAFGNGNMTISADTTTLATKTDLNSKQDTLVSGTNIKTINNQSLLGSGNITIQSGGVTSVNGQTGAVTVNDVKVGNTAPSNPTDGIVWYDTDLYNLQVYNGSTHQWDTLNNIFHMVTPGVGDDMADYINILEDSGSRLLIFSFNENMSDLWIVTDYGRENWDEQTQKYENFKITAIGNVSDNADTTFIQNWGLTRPKGIATLEIIGTHQLDTYVCSTVQFKESGGLKVAPNSPITGIKYIWYGTEADYNNLSQYYTDTPGDTEFRCF